jgi:flavin-dependent dehydrogenase
MSRAKELGVDVRDSTTISAIEKAEPKIWKIDIGPKTIAARILVGADGRNSTIARLCDLLPRPTRERIALQSHIPLPKDFGKRVVLQFLPEGYSGQAPVNERELNLCLVGVPASISSLRLWAEKNFGIAPEHQWRTITPLTRAAISPAHENLLLIGDAARVVEPFTGEGIYYALRGGELAAGAMAKIIHGQDQQPTLREFKRAHAAMYRGRLWINQLTRTAVLSPRFASIVLRVARFQPSILRILTRKITTTPPET